MAVLGERKDLPPVQTGRCDFCGGKVSRLPSGVWRKFCDIKCQRAFWKQARMRGGQVYKMLVIWRKHRGRAGTPGQAMMGEIASMVDQWAAEDRNKENEK